MEYLFSSSSSSSDHDNFDYVTPVRKNPVFRKLFVNDEIIDVDTYDMDKEKMNADDVGGRKNDVHMGKKNVNIEIDSDDDEENNLGRGKNDVDDDINIENENIGFAFPNINDVVPCVGMNFDTLDDAEKFYRDYGRSVGFQIIIRGTNKHQRSGEPSSRTYICIKGGRITPSKSEDRGKGKRIRESIPRTNCHARMCLAHNVKTNKWKVTLVDLEHNHDMVAPEKVQFFQRSRNIDPLTRSLIELFNKSGIETNKVMKYLSETCGGVENLGFSHQDVRNVIRDIRRRVFDSGDAECGLVLLRELQENNFGNFFYRVDLDEENRVRGLVWVDPRCLNAYKNFGDVVTFDSTYRTNKYCMPFIPITGVNHHYQNILFGFALMRDEKETSYKWVLKTWLEAVDNKAPTTIITDQDLALGNAIADVMPETKHMYCTWHISSKFPEKLSSLYTNYPEFKTDFNACVYKSLTPTEFEGRWEELVENYDLQNHDWLNEMYAIRGQWIGAYTRQHFSAGMTTTSRSESMNAFFDEYVRASTGLKEFIENSQKALESQYLREVKADYETEEWDRKLVLHSPLEIDASEIYTKEMFRRFQTELLKSTSYQVTRARQGETYLFKLYLVEKCTVPENRRRSYLLTAHFDGKLECTCKNFEHSGMICKHMIRYLDKKQKLKIPKLYIMPRWTMKGNKIAGPLPYTPPVLANIGASQSSRYSALCKSFQNLGAIASCSVPRFNYVMNVIEREKYNVKNNFPEEQLNEKKNESFDQDDYQHDPIFDPPMSQTKGRKKSGRYKSGVETSTSKAKPRKCGKCGVEGAKHDRRNCPNPPLQ